MVMVYVTAQFVDDDCLASTAETFPQSQWVVVVFWGEGALLFTLKYFYKRDCL